MDTTTLARKRAAARLDPPPSDRWLPFTTLPLRLFLGATFVYAGLQKIADPGFLQPGAPTYIGTQLEAFAAQSPIGFLITAFASATPQATGVAVIATELAVGALVLAGIATRQAAVVGALVNFVFFLSASWNVQPYFLGSDSIYTVAWITLALVGDQGVWTARPLLFGQQPAGRARSAFNPARRRFLLQVGGAAVATVFVLAVLPRQRRLSAASPAPSTTPESTATPSTAATPSGTKVGAASDLRANGFLVFSNPANGDPAIAVSLANGNVVAYDAVCTHAGCTVEYVAGQRVLECPCHGAVFDPAHNAAVLQGPAPTPLDAIRVQVAGDGNVYAG